MTCHECKKRPATLHFKSFSNGKKTEIHLCDICAKEKGYMFGPEEGYSLHNLLSGLFNFDTQNVEDQRNPYQQTEGMICNRCGLSLTEFRRYGKFGCADCYESFKNHLNPILRRVHSGNTRHNGKIPKRQGGHLHKKKELELYKEQLKQLVQREEFEKAAIVRDKIKELKARLEQGEAGDEK